MKIAIVDFTGISKIPGMEDREGCGASDRAILELCKNLPKMHHEVHFFAATTAQGNFDGTIWHNIVEDGFECDVLIMQRVMVYREKFKYKKMIMWLHDDIDAPVNKNLDQIINLPDAFIVLSTFHKNKLLDLGVDEKKIHILPEGVTAERFGSQEDRGQSCVYASAPFKGLPLLIKLWPKIRAKVPRATLHICSGMQLYKAPEKDQYFKPIYDAISKDSSIINHGVLTNKEVLKVMGDCAIMAYPNFFPETYCAAATEAISQNTPVITTDLGALKETVNDCGIVISGDPKTHEYQDNFVNTVAEILLDTKKLRTLRIHCTNRYIMTWEEMVEGINEIAEELNSQ